MLPSNSNWLRSLSGAWIFYTIFPALPWIEPNFEQIARFAPLIGLIIGSMQSVLWVALDNLNWPTISNALIIISFGIIATGGIHFDGLIDTADGIAAGKEKRIEAIKDSNIGAIGFLSAFVVSLLQIAALIKLNSLTIIALPIAAFWGRCSPLWAIHKFEYLHKNKHFNHKRKWTGIKETFPSIIIIILIILYILLAQNLPVDKHNLILFYNSLNHFFL